MDFTVERKEVLTIIKATSDSITSLNADELKEILKELKAECVKNINLHIASVNFVDSSGLSVILIARKTCLNAGGSFVLSGLHPNVTKLLQIAQLDTILDTTPTMAEAEDYIKMEELTREISGL